MKKLLFLIGGLLSSWAITAQNIENQAVSYSDAAILFSNTELNGTSRFNAMGGAFGALGGDLSATSINPAGTAVFKDSEFSLSFGVRNNDTGSTFYDNSLLNENRNSNLTQGGGVLVFNGRHSHWSKFAIGFNYSLANDFNNNLVIQGSSIDSQEKPITPLTNVYDPNVDFPYANEQLYSSRTNGRNSKYTLSFASELNKKIHVGAAITTHNIEFAQTAQAEELNSDDAKNTFAVVATQRLLTSGNGVSFSAGIIARPVQELRLGIAVESPTYYTLVETLDENNHTTYYNDKEQTKKPLNLSELEYNISTPARVTGSLAYIFGKQGLISFDYTYRDYSNISLKPDNSFNGENKDLKESLDGASEYRIGGEYRFDNISLRGGYFFTESPFTEKPNNSIKQTYGDTSGYSLGLGFKFGRHTRLDLAYMRSERLDLFKFQDVTDVKPANLDFTTNKFTATLEFGF